MVHYHIWTEVTQIGWSRQSQWWETQKGGGLKQEEEFVTPIKTGNTTTNNKTKIDMRSISGHDNIRPTK